MSLVNMLPKFYNFIVYFPYAVLIFSPLFIYFYFTLQYCIGFAIHWHESTTGVHEFQSWTPLPLPSPYHLSGSSQCTSPKHPVSCIKHRLAIHFLHDRVHVSMPFSQIIPPSPSPIESKRLFNTSVSHTQSYRYHLSKFYIYVCLYTVLVFFFLTFFTLYNWLQFHLPH